jgi:hypothetical protein
MQAHFLHRLDIAGPGAKGDAVEDVDNLGAVRRIGGQPFLRARHASGNENGYQR